jgi:hypothetical protein
MDRAAADRGIAVAARDLGNALGINRNADDRLGQVYALFSPCAGVPGSEHLYGRLSLPGTSNSVVILSYPFAKRY